MSIYNIDLYSNTATTISDLKASGKKIICSFAAGVYESSRSDALLFPDVTVGNDVPGVPGAKYLDISSYTTFQSVITGRLDLAVSKGCDGVEVTYMGTYTASGTGFLITAEHQLTYNQWIANQAHSRNLAIGIRDNNT